MLQINLMGETTVTIPDPVGNLEICLVVFERQQYPHITTFANVKLDPFPCSFGQNAQGECSLVLITTSVLEVVAWIQGDKVELIAKGIWVENGCATLTYGQSITFKKEAGTLRLSPPRNSHGQGNVELSLKDTPDGVKGMCGYRNPSRDYQVENEGGFMGPREKLCPKCVNCWCAGYYEWLGSRSLEACASTCTASGQKTFMHASGARQGAELGDNNCACCNSADTKDGDNGWGVDVYSTNQAS
jgi:hypothetical protein